MKKILPYLLILIAASILSGCKKETPISTELAGTWELKTSINGQTGQPTEYAANNGHVLKYTPTRYEIYENFKLIQSGTYTIKQDTILIYNKLGNKIFYDNRPESGTIYTVDNNELSLAYDAYDAGGSVYRRVK